MELKKVDLADTNKKKSQKLVKMDQMVMIDLEREADLESTLARVSKASVTLRFDDF